MNHKKLITHSDCEILIVDDAPENLEILSELLISENLKLRLFEDPVEALESAFDEPPTLILSDILMPEMDGFKLCNRLKQDKRTVDIPVIFISALENTKDKIHAFDVGGVDYINKPFQPEEVLARVHIQLDLAISRHSLEITQQELKNKVHEQTSDLAKNEAQFRRLIEKSPDLLYSYSDQRGGLYYSPRVKDLLGYTPRYLLQHPNLWHDSIHQQDLPLVNSAIKGLFLGKGFDIEYRIRDAEGNWHWFHDRSIDIRHEGEESIAEGLASDITLRKQIEQELINSEKQSSALLEAIPDLIFRTNRQGVILYFRAAGSDLYVQPPESIIGKNSFEVLPPNVAELINHKISQTLGTGEIQTFDYQLPLPEKGLRDYEARMVKSDDDEVTTIVRDITERKKDQNELHRSRERLRALSRHLQLVREDEKKNIAREIHDELGGTLTAIKLDADWLQQKLDGELLEIAGKIANMTESVLLSVHRIMNELRPPLLDDMGLLAAIEWQLDEFEKRTRIKGVLDFSCEACKQQGSCENQIFSPLISIALFRIAQEALTNISRHAHATQVVIGCRIEAGEVIFSIKDNGIGFDVSLIEKPASHGIRGMLERARSLKLRLKIESKINTGTSIKISLPLNEHKNHE